MRSANTGRGKGGVEPDERWRLHLAEQPEVIQRWAALVVAADDLRHAKEALEEFAMVFAPPLPKVDAFRRTLVTAEEAFREMVAAVDEVL